MRVRVYATIPVSFVVSVPEDADVEGYALERLNRAIEKAAPMPELRLSGFAWGDETEVTDWEDD